MANILNLHIDCDFNLWAKSAFFQESINNKYLLWALWTEYHTFALFIHLWKLDWSAMVALSLRQLHWFQWMQLIRSLLWFVNYMQIDNMITDKASVFIVEKALQPSFVIRNWKRRMKQEWAHEKTKGRKCFKQKVNL